MIINLHYLQLHLSLLGSFRVLQRAALQATTAAPTYFKPVQMNGEMYSDGGIVASNPTCIAIHEGTNIESLK